MVSARPPDHVRAAFGARGEPVRLQGGQRPVWRCGELVLKALDTAPSTIAWQADVLGRVDALADPGIRVAPPVPALDRDGARDHDHAGDADPGIRVAPPVPALDRDGARDHDHAGDGWTVDGWTVDGWTAWRWEPGVPAPPDWRAVAAAGRAFHAVVRDVGRPEFLDTRDDVWARADRLVTDDGSPAPHPVLAAAFAARRPVPGPDRLVHGDLTGNVHLDPAGVLPPLVLDLSPYWHPTSWASAVVVADALLFHDAAPDVVAAVADDEPRADGRDFAAVLLRAVLFRVVTGLLVGRDPTSDPAVGRTLDLTLSLLGR